MKSRTIKKSALALSVFLLILWCIFGTGTSLAWFADTTPVAKNAFDIGELDLTVYHKVDGEYKVLHNDDKVFDDEALYEPGYTQVVFLKIENNGDIDFDYKLSVIVDAVHTALGVNNNEIYLPNYLRFGAIFGDDEAQLTREAAQAVATMEMSELSLNNYSHLDAIEANDTRDSARYVALVVYMPEEVGNEANYRDDDPPTVELGISVLASQKGTIS